MNLPTQPTPSYFALPDGRNVVLLGAAMAHAERYARSCVQEPCAELSDEALDAIIRQHSQTLVSMESRRELMRAAIRAAGGKEGQRG